MWDVLNMFTYQTDGTLVQDITADAASTNVIDLDKADIDISSGQKSVFLVAKVVEAFAGGSLTSLEVLFETSTEVAGTYIQLLQRNVLKAQLVAGAAIYNQQFPVALLRRFIRLTFNVVTTATAGSIIAGLTDGPETAELAFDSVNL